MKVTTRSSLQKLKFPPIQVHQLLDGQMTLYVRAWGSQEYNQKFIDEVEHYLSTAQADIDVTSPFEYKESISSIANKTRIAMLLAHDHFYKVENKNDFSVGFESVIFFQSKNELAWSAVGRFRLQKIHENYVQTLFEIGSDLDSETLLPAELIGIESEIDVHSGSLTLTDKTQLILSSVYGGDVAIQNFNSDEIYLQPTTGSATYWYSLMRRN